jgi:hypothetical protein
MKQSELFFGLCKYYSSLGLDQDVSWSTWSQRTVSYFDQLGRMLGYVVQTEDTLTDMDNWKCPKAMKGKRIDMTWIHPNRDEYAIALEHQGSNSLEKIALDIKKLCLILGLKVLVVYRQNTLEIQKIVAREVPKIDGQEGSFLLINIPDYFRDKRPIKRLEARLIDENGKLVAAGTAEARKESITGLRFFSNIRWHHLKT